MALGREIQHTGSGSWAAILRRDDLRMTANPQGAKGGPPGKPKPRMGNHKAGEPRGRAGRSSEENPRRESVHRPQKLTISCKGRGEPRLFQSCLPGVPTSLDTWVRLNLERDTGGTEPRSGELKKQKPDVWEQQWS